MEFLWMAVVGLMAGALAKLLMPGRQGGGLILTMLLGMGGALLVGFLGRAMGLYDGAGEGPGLIAATIGAFVILAIYAIVTRRRAVHP